jgi:hypothetical protein
LPTYSISGDQVAAKIVLPGVLLDAPQQDRREDD